MAKKFKHLVCTHQYTEVEGMRVELVLNKHVFDNNLNVRPDVLLYSTMYRKNDVLYDKACLKCGHCTTELTDFRNKLAALTYKDIEKLEEKARKDFILTAKKAKAMNERRQQAKKVFSKFVKERK